MTSHYRPPILHAIESFGGGSYQVLRRVVESTASDYRAIVLHGHREDSPLDFERDFPPDTTFISWPVSREIAPVRDLRALRFLRHQLESQRPALVHAHSTKAGALARIGAVGLGIPVVYSPHGYSFQRKDVAWSARTLYRTLEFALGRLPYLTVACGPSELVLARSVARSVVEVPNSVDVPSLAARITRAAESRRPVVAGIGRIAPQKDFGLFVSLSIEPTLADVDFVWFGGPTPTGDVGRVNVTGWLPQDELYTRLVSADVIAVTSAWEGLPLAVLEAMALARPIVARRIPGMTDVVVDGETGYLCDGPSDFVTAIRRLVDDRHAGQDMGSRGLELVKRRHDASKVGERWRRVYDASLTSPAPRPRASAA